MAITLKGVLGTIAPVLASLLPGPLGGMVQKLVASALGSPDASPAEIDKILATASPDTLLKLKQAEDDFVTKMKGMDVDLEKLAVDDKASARTMQVATKSRVPAVLAAVVVIGWIGMVIYLMTGTIPPTNREIVIQAVGTMSGALMLVLGFYYGSSSASAKKDETISNLSS